MVQAFFTRQVSHPLILEGLMLSQLFDAFHQSLTDSLAKTDISLGAPDNVLAIGLSYKVCMDEELNA